MRDLIEPCPIKACPSRGPRCPFHDTVKPAAGFSRFDAMMRQRPGDATRGGGTQWSVVRAGGAS